MSKQLTLSSVLAVFAMVALAILNTAHPVDGETGLALAPVQAELPHVNEDALGLLAPWFVAS